MVLESESFRSPAVAYRGAPFWSWNDTMEERHLTDQLNAIKDGGWGGGFIHPRAGLDVEFLSDEWLDRVRHTVETAANVGVEPWLYDEDRWPSGSGAGTVPDLGRSYRLKYLALRTAPGGEVVGTISRGGEEYYVCVVVPDAEELSLSKITNNGYADLMNPDAVEAFVDNTYAVYEDAIGEYFGDVVPGIFTDEPQLFRARDLPAETIGFLPWTGGLPELFESEYGYDLGDHFGALFFDSDVGDRSYQAVRYDFWRLVTRRFVEVFSERIGEWCRDRDLALTGHYLHEDSIPQQIRAVGAVMPHYQHQGRPGIDHLGLNIDNPLTPIQCASVARQFDRPAMSELYGGSGQALSFAERKWIGDWHLAHGITSLTHHLSLYSMRGERKRDFPPNLFYQQPWWDYNDRIADYFARLSYALRQGSAVANVLVLHPVQTGWMEYTSAETSDGADATERLHDRFEAFVEALSRAHVQFDLGDELIVESHGGLDDGSLRVGESRYGSVVVPYCGTLQRSTVELLTRFADRGGDVFVVGEPPSRVDGRPGGEEIADLRAAAEHVTTDAVARRVHRPLRLVGEDGEAGEAVRTHVRETDDGLIAFLANASREARQEAELRIDRDGRLARWDPIAGKSEPVPTTGDGETVVDVGIPRIGSLLLTLDESTAPATNGTRLDGATPSHGPLALDTDRSEGDVADRSGSGDADRPGDPNRSESGDVDRSESDDADRSRSGGMDRSGSRVVGRSGSDEIDLSDTDWRLRRSDPNQLVIDRCDLVIDGRRHDDTAVARHWIDVTSLHDEDGHVPFRATYTFDVSDAVVGNSVEIVVESADQQQVAFNGDELSDTERRWRDVHWHRFDVTDRVEPGTNTVAVEGTRDVTVDIEAVYVLGDFSVDPDTHRLSPEPDTVRPEDVTDQGYPFYTGELTIATTVDVEDAGPGRFAFDDLRATLASVRVGDGEQREVYFPPWEVPVALEEGRNEVEVTLVTSLRNLTGPHHVEQEFHPHGRESNFVSPATFRHPENLGSVSSRAGADEWTDDYNVVSVGIENPRLIR